MPVVLLLFVLLQPIAHGKHDAELLDRALEYAFEARTESSIDVKPCWQRVIDRLAVADPAEGLPELLIQTQVLLGDGGGGRVGIALMTDEPDVRMDALVVAIDGRQIVPVNGAFVGSRSVERRAGVHVISLFWSLADRAPPEDALYIAVVQIGEQVLVDMNVTIIP